MRCSGEVEEDGKINNNADKKTVVTLLLDEGRKWVFPEAAMYARVYI